MLSDPALKVMDALRLHLHDLGRISGGMADGFQSFVNKLPGMAGSLTLILHMITNPKVKPEVAPATVENVRRLRERGHAIVEPGEGVLACGMVGPGRLAEPEAIAAVVALGRSQ